MQVIETAILVALCLYLLPTKKDFIIRAAKRIAKLPESQYEEIYMFIIGGSEDFDRSLWRKSRGLKGLLTRLRASYHYLGFIQSATAEGYIEIMHGTYLWWRIGAQLAFTILAVICHIFPVRNWALRIAATLYCQIELRSVTLSYKCPIPLS